MNIPKKEKIDSILSRGLTSAFFIFFSIYLIANSAPLVWTKWNAPDSLYSFGYLVPILSFFFIFKNREKRPLLLRQNLKIPHHRLLLAGMTLLLYFYFHKLPFHFGEFLTAILFFRFFFEFLFGRNWILKNKLALNFLFLMAPMPDFTMIHFSFFLRELSSHTSYFLIKPFFSSSLKMGNTLIFNQIPILISDACNGLKTWFLMLCFAVYFSLKLKKRMSCFFLVLFSFFISILANSIRILLLTLLITHQFQFQNREPYHSLIGIFPFLIGVFLIERMSHFLEKKELSENRLTPRLILLSLTALLILIPLYFQRQDHGLQLTTSTFSLSPSHPLSWRKKAEKIFPETFQILGTPKIQLHSYENPQIGKIYLYEVLGSGDSSVAHPPEICFKSEGFEIETQRDISFVWQGKKISALKTLYRRGSEFLLSYHWYELNQETTSSYFIHQIQFLKNLALGEKPISKLIRVSAQVHDLGSSDPILIFLKSQF